MGLGSHTSDGPGESKISNFVVHIRAILLKQHIFRLDVPVNEVFLMNAFESFHDLKDDPDSLPQREYFPRHLSLISEKVALLTVLHDNDYEIVCYVRIEILVNSY